MTALLGPPPPEFLSRSEETSKYWGSDGRYHSTDEMLKLYFLRPL